MEILYQQFMFLIRPLLMSTYHSIRNLLVAIARLCNGIADISSERIAPIIYAVGRAMERGLNRIFDITDLVLIDGLVNLLGYLEHIIYFYIMEPIGFTIELMFTSLRSIVGTLIDYNTYAWDTMIGFFSRGVIQPTRNYIVPVIRSISRRSIDGASNSVRFMFRTVNTHLIQRIRDSQYINHYGNLLLTSSKSWTVYLVRLSWDITEYIFKHLLFYPIYHVLRYLTIKTFSAIRSTVSFGYRYAISPALRGVNYLLRPIRSRISNYVQKYYYGIRGLTTDEYSIDIPESISFMAHHRQHGVGIMTLRSNTEYSIFIRNGTYYTNAYDISLRIVNDDEDLSNINGNVEIAVPNRLQVGPIRSNPSECVTVERILDNRRLVFSGPERVLITVKINRVITYEQKRQMLIEERNRELEQQRLASIAAAAAARSSSSSSQSVTPSNVTQLPQESNSNNSAQQNNPENNNNNRGPIQLPYADDASRQNVTYQAYYLDTVNVSYAHLLLVPEGR
eukprot:TRINITY_DN4451_c0_g1_i1.p1 TRINITY_DN4451_c0_g1~~TRINITY_DN4451_c0_g1_i1.p1  ORF type:complete len:507 (+),score=77.34 TRINITY_DN4451_c0_g1_i1:78-1598(+)